MHHTVKVFSGAETPSVFSGPEVATSAHISGECLESMDTKSALAPPTGPVLLVQGRAELLQAGAARCTGGTTGGSAALRRAALLARSQKPLPARKGAKVPAKKE